MPFHRQVPVVLVSEVQKITPFAAQMAAETAANTMEHGLKTVELYVKGGFRKGNAIRSYTGGRARCQPDRTKRLSRITDAGRPREEECDLEV